jgi:glycolate dehydrogenase iron-sulfur subunit
MQTSFSEAALADPDIAASEAVIRKCVHCGFCTATCPTYILLGDELDSPRGRIYLMKDMLEEARDPTPTMVKHVDRCLSCLSCMTTCPSGVNYMHLVDHARAYIEERYRRPLRVRLLRWMLARLLPRPGRFRLALALARLAKPVTPLFAKAEALKPISAMLALVPERTPAAPSAQAPEPVAKRGRVVLLQGCVEPVLRPEIRAATMRLLSRAGFETVFARGEGCCGALVHHMGRKEEALAAARRNVDAWMAEIEGPGVDAILTTASGCGVTLKDYGFMLREDPDYAEKAALVSGLAKDICEFLATIDLPEPRSAPPFRVAYHAACALQHGQKITDQPKLLLQRAGFEVKTPDEAHLCCGSAGVYNILQPELAAAIGARKVERLERLKPDVIATGNIGCATQIGTRVSIPVVHTVELLDWATGGPKPSSLSAFADF